MNTSKYKSALYAIVLVIMAVIAIQVYWNIINYKSNKQQLINDVQVSLDNAVDTYYNQLANKNTLGITFEGGSDFKFFEDLSLLNIGEQLDEHHKAVGNIDSFKLPEIEHAEVIRGVKPDSFFAISSIKSRSGIKLSKEKYNEKGENIGSTSFTFKDLDSLPDSDAIRLLGLNNNGPESLKTVENDSNKHSKLKFLTSKIVVSITTDSIPLKELDTILRKELKRKEIELVFGLKFMEKDSSFSYLNKNVIDEAKLTTQSKSTFLPKNTKLDLYFVNTTKEILYRSFGGMAISFLLVLTVVSILFYLLRIINDQKQLAEIKNDLISNITHEFKTPIATVGVALESMKNFNALDDKKKAKKYIDMSEVQMTKLNTMVEKLLETASLDSDNLSLNFERVNLTELVENVIANHSIQAIDKNLNFKAEDDNITLEADPFHLENAISNLVDNAIKYGGDDINLNLKKVNKTIYLNVMDNGSNLNKSDIQRIFDKFYRVPTGNTHDVKGFGIGLYYTKKIIERHKGNIKLELNNNVTNFKITLPNER